MIIENIEPWDALASAILHDQTRSSNIAACGSEQKKKKKKNSLWNAYGDFTNRLWNMDT